MGINLKLSSSASGTRNTGPVNMGGGANLIERSLFSSSTPTLPYSQWYTPGNGSPAISTSDYYLLAGMSWSRPYDLDAMGSDGATIKAANGGNRYVWLLWSDHSGNWPGSVDLMAGFSNDPQIWPEPTTVRTIHAINNLINVVDQNGYTQNSCLAYQTAHLVYNPDSAGDKFYIYAEGFTLSSSRQHELALLTTADFMTTTFVGFAIPTTNFDGWASYGRPERLGINTWEVYAFGKVDASATNVVHYKYTSTDGFNWTPNYSTIVAGPGPYFTISGQKYMLAREDASPNSYLSLLAVNSSNVSQGTYTRISTGYGDNGSNILLNVTPGPTYLQETEGYEEDGIATIYATRGFPVSNHDTTNAGPFLNNFPTYYDIDADITSNVLTVYAPFPSNVPALAVGFRIREASGKSTITSFGTGTGGAGTYNMASTGNVARGTLRVFTNGGLWNQFIDMYYLTTNATTAASAAPLGVRVSCTSGVVTIQWNNSLPHSNYRVYRGTTVGTQATLIGDVTGTSITDTPTAGSQYFYKVVTMNSGEQKSRVVSVYASNNTAMVNKHVNRVINDGGDITKIDMTFLASADSWLTSNNAYRYVQWWADVRFGIKVNGSGFISKIYDLGTTYMPRGGDYTPTTSSTFPSTSSNTSYSTTSFRGTTPSWVNNASNAWGYFGNGRANNIQRWSEITLLAAYQKPGTAVATLFGHGENTGLYLQHEAGSAGNVKFSMVCDKVGAFSTFTHATAPFTTATAAHVAAGVFDGTNMICYLDGVAGTPQSGGLAAGNTQMLNDTILRGQFALDASSISTGPVLASGSQDTRFTYKTRTYNFGNSHALFTGAALAGFNKGLSAAQVQSWGALYA